MCISLSDSMCPWVCATAYNLVSWLSVMDLTFAVMLCQRIREALPAHGHQHQPLPIRSSTETHKPQRRWPFMNDTSVWNIQTGWQILTKTRILRLFSLNNCHCPLPTVTKWHRWLLKIKTNYHVQTEKNKINRFGFTIPLTNSERMNEETQQLLQSFSW